MLLYRHESCKNNTAQVNIAGDYQEIAKSVGQGSSSVCSLKCLPGFWWCENTKYKVTFS